MSASVAQYPADLSPRQAAAVRDTILRFVKWLDEYGETSWDHQTYFAGEIGRRAKSLYYRKPLLGTLAVAPMIFSEAFLPSARRFFAAKQRFPIADAHYAMGFAYLYQALGDANHYRRAVHFLEILQGTRAPEYKEYGWGYPFDWETRHGTIRKGTPLITTVPYVYEAFEQVYRIDGNRQWLEIMKSIARHAFADYHDLEVSASASTCSYDPTPKKIFGVVNASAYRAFLLTRAGRSFCDDNYLRAAERNLNFVLESQNTDGSWYYSTDGGRDFVDHFHTCFVLKALAKIERMSGNPRVTRAIEKGAGYYVRNLFDHDNLPKPFSRRPRLTVYRSELYDYAECINLAIMLKNRFPELDAILARLLPPEGWQKRDGSFRARKLMLGWDNTPMHRWAQAQMFRSLCLGLYSGACEHHKQTAG